MIYMKKFFSLIVVLLLVWCSEQSLPQEVASDEVVQLAQCITDKWRKMYGTERCQFCQNQKKWFASAWNIINFVDCDKQQIVCRSAGIQSFPTWIWPNNQRLVGLQTHDALKQNAGCDQPTMIWPSTN
jgi:hypothetical protein